MVKVFILVLILATKPGAPVTVSAFNSLDDCTAAARTWHFAKYGKVTPECVEYDTSKWEK